MKAKYLFFAALALIVMPSMAQETYENVKLANQDLNGTARYVGMGGAMDALGADLSVMSTNPAGIGLFRRSKANVSFGFVSQQGGSSFDNSSKTYASFDQAGFVYAMPSGPNSYMNFGFNYHKSKNFDYILSAAGRLNGASQNMYTYIKARAGMLYDSNNKPYYTCTRLDELYANSIMAEDAPDTYTYKPATGFLLNRANTGYIGTYDFNVSGNIDDRVYLGLTFGIHDVHYKGYSEYTENLEPNATNRASVTVADERRISGTGFDVKAGIIVRPVDESPFRIGASVSSPVWYDLTSDSHTSIDNKWVDGSYSFKLYTPWKFGLSMGHTVANKLALGAVFEYEDYGSMDSRVNESHGWSWTDGYYDNSSSDVDMNDHTKETLKGVSTLKLGMEYNLMPNLALRIGYNIQSGIYDMQAAKGVYKNGEFVQSPGIYYSSTMDYVNWKDTNRLTFGIGYQYGNFTVDAAYQYSRTDGELHAFTDSYGDFTNPTEMIDNYATVVNVSNKRHQLLLTLGYRF